MVEHTDMIPRFHRDIVLPVCCKCFEYFAVGQNINMLLRAASHLNAFINNEARKRYTANQKEEAESPYMLKSAVDIFSFGKHGLILGFAGYFFSHIIFRGFCRGSFS